MSLCVFVYACVTVCVCVCVSLCVCRKKKSEACNQILQKKKKGCVGFKIKSYTSWKTEIFKKESLCFFLLVSSNQLFDIWRSFQFGFSCFWVRRERRELQKKRTINFICATLWSLFFFFEWREMFLVILISFSRGKVAIPGVQNTPIPTNQNKKYGGSHRKKFLFFFYFFFFFIFFFCQAEVTLDPGRT